jgi:flagellar protein FlgJ
MVSSAVVAGLAGSGQAGTAAVTAADARLKPAAHEFEACLMKEFLEPLQKDPLFSEDGDGGEGEGSGNALMSFGSEALARAISERGGFGIATKIVEQFKTGKTSQEKAESAADTEPLRQQ